MKTLIITEENIESFADIIPEDVAENMSHNNFCGIAVQDEDEEVMASLVFELQNSEDAVKDTQSRLSFLSADDPVAGEALFSKYGSVIRYEEVKRSFTELSREDSEGLLHILRDAGFSFTEKEGEDLIVTIKDLSGLSIVNKKRVPPAIRALGTLDELFFRRGLMNCIFHTKREVVEDLGSLPFAWFDPDISCYLETDDRINGFLLIHRLPSGSLRIEFLSAYGPDAKMDLMFMIRFSILKAIKLCREDTKVILRRHDEATRNLTGYLFPGKKGEPCMYGERTEG